MNAARALVDVVVKCQTGTSSLLVTQLQTQILLEKIFKFMLSGVPLLVFVLFFVVVVFVFV